MVELKPFTVTVLVFDPATADVGQAYELPVDSPDEEHAVSAAMSNAIAFTRKVENGQVKAVAFRCNGVKTRLN